jgi:molybdenum cofactor cytidylyltransferase
MGRQAATALRSLRLRDQANIVGLLLAAGSASRFGSDKLRHALPHGVPIAVQALRHLAAGVREVFAVVKPGDEGLFPSAACTIVVCERAAEGMGASLACAARAAGKRAGYLVALADMPFIRPSSIAAVRAALEAGAALAAPYFRSRRGHPVGFAGEFHDPLISLEGDEGARSVLEQHAARMVKIPIGDPGVVRDIDRPDDLVPPIRV